MIKKFYNKTLAFFTGLFFYRENGVVYVKEKCLQQEELFEKNIAGSRLLAVFNASEIETMLINGKSVDKWYKLKRGDVVEVVIRPEKLNATEIISAVVAIALIVFNPVGSALYATGVALAVSTGVSVISRLLLGTPDGSEDIDDTKQRADITGAENRVSKGVVPVLFGRHAQTPFYGQRPYRLINDGSATNKYKQYFISNYNDVNIEDEKLGRTAVGDFSSQYLDITKSFGGTAFIGGDNVKSVPREEQLSVDTASQTNEVASYSYNQATTTTSIDYEATIEFTNVDTSNWGNKTFEIVFNTTASGSAYQFSYEFPAVTVGDLTLVSGTTYRATLSHTFTETITEINSTTLRPVSDTRLNATEEDNLLDVEAIEQDITTDDWSTTTTLNAPINKYIGVLSEVVETSPDNTTEIDLIISFPQGLFVQNNDGSRSSRSTTISVEFKEVGGSYQDISSANALYVRDIDGVKQSLGTSTTTVSGKTVTLYPPSDIKQADELFFRTIGMELDAGQYVVRVRSADLLEKTSSDVGYPVMSEFNFFVTGDPVNTSILPQVNQIAVDAIAYKELSGELKQYNYIGKLACPIWDGTDWDTVAETRNPASIVRYLLTDTKVNPRAESVSLLDNDSLTAFYDFCETNNYYADGVITSETKIGDIITTILDNCKATFTFIGGKYVFVYDDDSKTPVDIFTQHNTWDFSWSPTSGRTTDAVRLKYINEDDFTEKEITLYYYDGDVYQTPKSGTSDSDYEIQVQDTKFITNEDHLIDRYSYSLRNIQERRSFFEFKCNLEALTLKLFDRIYVANTCDMENESSGLIKEVITSGGNITGFKLYSKIDVVANSVITIRSIDTVTEQVVINTYDVNNTGFTDTLEIDPITNSGIIKGKGTMNGFNTGYTWDYDGDHFDVGVSTIYECLVTEIRYGEDLTATITAREVNGL